MTMTTADIRLPVAPPPVVDHPYGLFSVVAPTPEGDSHAELGIQWRRSPGCVEAAWTVDPCISGTAGEGHKEPLNACPDLNAFKPFTVYVREDRSGPGADDATDEVEADFAAAEETAVERFLWNSAFPAVATNLNPQATLVEMLAEIELALAAYNGTGIIHMSPWAATVLGLNHLRPAGTGLVTTIGTPVVIGAGYISSGTALAMVGTGAMVIRRSTRQTLNGWNLEINSNEIIVERTYVVGWDCLAVQVTLKSGGT